MTSPYLLRVNSNPVKVDAATWEKWYLEEHIPDLVDGGVATRAALYKSTHDLGGLSTATEIPADEKQFLALYQTEHAVPLETKEYKSLRTTSEMLPGKDIMPCAEWDVRNYELIEDRDPKGLGHQTPPPFILNVIMEPTDDEDYLDWYKNEHLSMLAKVPGYRRSQRYRLGKPTGMPENPPRFLVVHEWDSLDALDGPELREADASPNTKRILANNKAIDVRGFKLVKAFNWKD